LNTKYEEIVDVDAIGKNDNTRNLNEILEKAKNEKLTPAIKNAERTLVIGIDIQKDFMENGALGVPGSHKDIERGTKWIYNNIDKISQISVSIDTHNPFQIFHPCWWIDENGNNPKPYTQITSDDINNGKWRAVINPSSSIEYVKHLETDGKKTLVIWPYHCLEGTEGHSLENQFANMIYFHSVAKKTMLQKIVKGQDPLSEMYGIIRPEYSKNNLINVTFLNKIEKFDKIIIFGEAFSHCVLESVRQILEYYENNMNITKKIYILQDCMSSIPGYEKTTEDTFEMFKNKYNINLVKSTEFNL